MEKAHSTIGASSAYRWMACPGSVALCDKAPPRPPSEYALVGTAAHELAELALRAALRGEVLDDVYAIASLQVEGVDIEVTPEMVAGVKTYVEEVMKAHQHFGGSELLIEESFDLSWLHPGMFGRNDALVMPTEIFGDLIVFDYKNGRHPVHAENNVQAMYYALGALGKDNPLMVERVGIVIVQPNAVGKDTGPVDTWEISATDLYKWAYDVLLPAVKATQADNAPLVQGGHCFFCNGQGICPAKHSDALAMLEEAGAAVAGGTPSMETTLADPKELPLETLGRASEFFNSKEFSAWVKELARTEEEVLRQGMEIPGRRLLEFESQGNRRWADPEEAKKVLTLDYGDEVLELKSPAQVEKALTALKVAKAERTLLMEGLVERPVSTKTKVVNCGPDAAVGDSPAEKAIDMFTEEI